MKDKAVDLWALDEVHFQQQGSRCRMWVPPEIKDPVVYHHPTRKSVGQALEEMDIRVLPYTREHAVRFFELPWHHADPFDRQILAQALAEDIPVVTSDEAFARYEGIRVIW